MANDTTVKCGVLIGIETMMHQFATCHLTNGVDKIPMVEIFKVVLIRIMSIGAAVEFMSGGVFNTVLIMSILGRSSAMNGNEGGRTYTVLLIEHKWGDGLTLVGAGPSLSTNADSGMANAEMVGSARDSAEGRRHCDRVADVRDNWSG